MSAAAHGDEPVLRAGVAEVVIPAEPGLDLAGFVARDNPSRGKCDEIYGRALALESGGNLLLLLSADVLGFEAATVRRIRDAAAHALADSGHGTRLIGTAVCATHTHSAPASMPLRDCGEVNAAWLGQAVSALAEAANTAAERLRPARLGTGSGTLRGVTGNRRTQQWARGENPPDFGGLCSEPVDPEVGVLRVDTAEGAPLACLVNFACHPVILGHENLDISADYPGVVTERLRERLGAVSLFTNGTAGDINPVRRGGWADVEWLASAVAGEAERVWAGVETRETAFLDARSGTVSLPLLPLPPRAELEAARQRFRQQQAEAARAGRATEMRVADAYRQWAEAALDQDAENLCRAVEVQALRIGSAALIGVPGEFFVESGLHVKERLAAAGIRPAWILGYTNGNVGYIPNRAAYAHGGYEVETAHRFYGHPACVAPEAGEAIVEAAVALAQGGRL
uniref:Neutral/alkaline non-lysosomal ceramidase N-terminal domain-containing protein n=1 Tax=uncultured Armatimonadetes bacterium TaxID=157466 RepID=A0A6J4K1I4_9BACT|nr:hypothetical protein AVDCRST_MAG63-4530 [uncultured Armatimonadetes bacterium]